MTVAATTGADDIDSLSDELSRAVGGAGLGSGDDEDLDEISNLISRTVTDFEPVDADADTATGTDDVDAAGGPKGLFGDDQPAVRTSGPLPPSVFGDDGTDPGVLGAVFDIGTTDDGQEAPADPFAAAEPAGDGESQRRQITVPDELADDEVEMARFVVSSPDVVLLVDGDSVAKMGWPSLPIAQQRDALVSYLADLAATSGAAPDVVFDGRIGEDEQLPSSRAVRIRLSTPPSEPAAALDELVDRYPDQWPVAIVTDDAELGSSAGARGATVLSNGQLLDLFLT